MIDVYLAAVKLGVIFVPINILYREREITHILGDSEPRAAVTSGELPGQAPVWQAEDLAAEAAALPADPAPPRAATTGDSPAAIVCTSGTTGASEGAILTHNNSREIEEFLLEQNEVAEAAVAGVPDRLRGEVPVAYVVARAPFEPGDLEFRCRQKLASFKIPRAFIAVDKLPRTALGKIQKHLLPKWESGG